ncbi:hypothetical protein ACWT_1966 [Actinoplanes sp. SE50]|uniref:DUF3349 domain-containing protein n=1 Tax=unclassified Actinoplanes TaxID=2626549 RepID=UPI00023EC087|nr:MULTISPECIES: DUF3349 domain-containing protein [unclassified Actinoplanes]AEV82985.1 hypothetical protein ACPL_2088 [Actinoplanes sp. SE50/110]ATO81381.1 hypothetical protein ACWT_1966 [Actinoplanes sp. SE50]SLL98788.1 hypothetical protein ACSP50_2015 [Actinoplanes sp. SE50/110]
MNEQRSNFVTRALGWLRAGYPEGVPRRDYVVLLGLLRRKLSEDEVRRIAQELAAQAQPGDGPITGADIEEMISQTMLQEATPADVVRVSAHLAAGGWPLADPPPAD